MARPPPPPPPRNVPVHRAEPPAPPPPPARPPSEPPFSSAPPTQPAPSAPPAPPAPPAKLEPAEKDAVRKALSDLEAAEARVQRHAQRVYDEAKSKLVLDLIPVLDNLDRTVQAASDATDDALLVGLRMVRDQLEGVLVRYGVERIEATGDRFDPTVHDAIATVEVSDPELQGIAVEQIEAGYRFGGRVLRAAKVRVGAYMPPAHGREAADRPPRGPLGAAPPGAKH